MKKLKYIIAAALLVFAGSCGNNGGEEASRELFAMDTVISVKAYGENSAEAVSAAAKRITELEELFSVTDNNSEISALNNHTNAIVSEDTRYVISEALKICESTSGALDVTIYPVLLEWGFTTDNMHVPADDEITAALARTGYEKVSVNGNRIEMPDGYMLDLGSCAKGYAGDEMIETMKNAGITSALVNLGGNVQALGARPDGSDWTVGIADPFSPNELLGVIKIHDKAVITSGGYQRYFTGDDGKVYIHILDPETGRPAESGIVSATVIGGNGLECDALSTALFVMGKERAVEYWRENGGFEMVLVTDSGTICITEGIEAGFRNDSGLPVETIYERE